MRLLAIGGVGVALFASGACLAWLIGRGDHRVSMQSVANPAPVTVRLARNKGLPAGYPHVSEGSSTSQVGTVVQPASTGTTEPVTTTPQLPSSPEPSTSTTESPKPQRKHGFVIRP
jgi:hypothetical protein